MNWNYNQCRLNFFFFYIMTQLESYAAFLVFPLLVFPVFPGTSLAEPPMAGHDHATLAWEYGV